MTTAHRATWKAAQAATSDGGSFRLHASSASVSAKDMPAHGELKRRRPTATTDREHLKVELERRERAAKRLRTVEEAMKLLDGPPESGADESVDGAGAGARLLDEAQEGTGDDAAESSVRQNASRDGSERPGDVDDGASKHTADEIVDDSGQAGTNPSGKNSAVQGEGYDSESNGDSENEKGEDDEDLEEDLLAELAQIRAEREARAKERATPQEQSVQNMFASNPLMQISAETGSFATASVDGSAAGLRRRWEDDAIFKNQARNQTNTEPRIVNDTIRNEFHRRFMKRYVR